MISVVVISALGALSAFFFALSLLPARSPVARALAALESRGTASTRDPAALRRFEKVFSAARRGQLERKLIEAGWYHITPGRIALRMVSFGLAGFVLSLVVVPFIALPLPVHIILGVLLSGAGLYIPLGALDKAIERRKKQVQKTLPDFLDMVAETVSAGQSVNASLAYSIDTAPGALGEEIKSALAEMRLGRSRADSLKAAADRLNYEQFTTTVTAIVQAERLGTNIARVLGELAEEVRHHRVMLAEEYAAKMPVKMVFPLACFLLPALFVIIFGSLIANYLSQQ